MRWLLLFGLIGCAEHGEVPSTCEVDLALEAKGSFVNEVFEVQANEPETRCLLLDASQGPMSLRIDETVFESPSLQFVLRGTGGTTLDSGAGAVALDVPAGKFYVELEIGTVREVSMVAARVSLEFSAQ